MYDISVILCDWRDTAVLVLGRVKIEKGEFHMIYDSRERERERVYLENPVLPIGSQLGPRR